MIWNSISLWISCFGWRRTLDNFTRALLIGSMYQMLWAPVRAEEQKPDPALLVMLSEIGDIEEMGVDVERLITERLEQKPKNEIQESTQ